MIFSMSINLGKGKSVIINTTVDATAAAAGPVFNKKKVPKGTVQYLVK